MSSLSAQEVAKKTRAWNHELANMCSLGQNHAGHCRHVQDINAAWMEQFEKCRSPQHSALVLCKLLHEKSPSCQVCKHKFRTGIQEMAQSIESHVQEWGQFDLLSQQWLVSNDNKRNDPHLKRLLGEQGVPEKRAKTVGGAIQAAGAKYEHLQALWLQRQALSAVSASYMQHFHEVPTVSVICDGIKIGKPAKEFIVTGLQDMNDNTPAMMPPVDSIFNKEGKKNALLSP